MRNKVDMKKLYALLIVLIVIYVGINVGGMAFHFDTPQVPENTTADVSEDLITVGASSFSPLDNFKSSNVNDTTLDMVDSSKGITIEVSEIDNSQGIEDIFNNFVANSGTTSTQTIDQNGVTTYFAYNVGDESYGANVFFNKNGQNYMLSGSDISNDNSDYFINNCKNIIDTIEINSIS